MFLGHLIARGILLGTSISDSSQTIKPRDNTLPLQRKQPKINRSVSVPAMMNTISEVV